MRIVRGMMMMMIIRSIKGIVKDLNMAGFALDNHPIVFGKAIHIQSVLHPILIITF